ncbi:MAG: DUF2326 domain-containing protein [Gammaproteobacteria bacterium]|nr:DUF2326 domain-containing protein [Gammaproteobacteria bacterium]
MVELLHFVFGSSAPQESIFRSALRERQFSVSVDIGRSKYRVTRSGDSHGQILVEPSIDSTSFLTDSSALSREEWCKILGERWFGLHQKKGTDTHLPTFRSLMPYIVRRQQSGGFMQATRHSTQQPEWRQQISICYLLGLDWRIPAKLRELHERSRLSDELRQALVTGSLVKDWTNSGDLRTALAVTESRADQLRSRLENFQVLPEYEQLEIEASEISNEVSELSLENVVDQGLIEELSSSISEEIPPGIDDLKEVYEEVGVVLPELPHRRFSEVEAFHQTIIANRRAHLQREIDAAEERIKDRNGRKTEIDERRQQIMGVLDGHGALQQYTALREELGRLESQCEELRSRLNAAEKLERTKAEVKIERAKLEQEVHIDIQERDVLINDLIVKFEELSSSLYEHSGSITVSASKSGPKITTVIDGERSKGITNMQIFCFDLALAELGMKKAHWPGFLVHDSHIFDGVDERQIAKALQLGARKARECEFQYIVALNSDALPKSGFEDGFLIEDYVLDTQLTDATETGGLFGFRF